MDNLVGKVIGPGGRYRLLAVIARGGMGTVYQAEQLNVPRQVAVKIADPVMAEQPTFVQRFRQEIGALARLEHEPHILPVYDVGDEDSLLYMVMPLVTGGTLKDKLEKARGQAWRPREALALIRQVLGALAYAHERGFIHRDVKPSNILLEGERVYLADFGIAKAIQDVTGGVPMGPTLTGNALMGTPTYMAPEQALGRQIDARADLYSVGVVLYEMLTGRVPYQADTPMEMAFKHVEAALPPPREMNPSLSLEIEALLLKAMARQPEQRFASAAAFIEALDEVAAELDSPRPVGPVESQPQRPGPEAGDSSARAVGQPLVTPPGTGGVSGAGRQGQFLAFQQELARRLDRIKVEQTERDRQLRGPDQAAREQTVLQRAAGSAAAQEALEREERLEQERRQERERAALQVAAVEQAAQQQQERQQREERDRLAREQAAREQAAREAEERRKREAAAPEIVEPDEARSRGIPRRVWIGGAAGAVAAAVLVPLAVRAIGNGTSGTTTPTGYGGTPSGQQTPGTTSGPTSPWWQLVRARVNHTATVLNDGRVLVAGGQGGDGKYLTAAEIFDPKTNGWTPAGEMSRTRAGHTASLLREGQVLVAGGQDTNSTYLASAELYEPATNRWVAVEPLSSARGDHTATVLPDGRVLVAGGKNDALYHATAEAYDPKDRRWRPAGRLSGVRKGHAAVLLPMGRGAVLVVGGVGEDAATALATAELYDVASNEWTATGPLAQPREGLTATLATKDGNALACGGYYSTRRDTGIGFVLPNEAERYDPSTKRWGTAGTMAQGRVAHTATVLPDGRVLIAGGQAADGRYLATAELYNPATNTWAPAGQMSRARGGHADALLRDGQVLVIGGQDSNEPLNSVERYDPKSNTWTTGH